MPITAILALLPTIVNTIGELTKFFHKTSDALKQDAELTPEQEKQLDDLIAQAPSKEAWQVKD